jgi:threonine 3-dehydrogenase
MDPLDPRLTARSSPVAALPATTRAAVWRGAEGVTVDDVPLPPPGGGEAVVKVRLATICGSDRHTVSGRRPAPCPSVLGHEAVGEVVALGPDGPSTVDGRALRIGDRVVWGVAVSCGGCDRCRAGRAAKCRRVRKVGHEAYDGDWPLSGGYAEHVVLPRGSALAIVPPQVPDVVAAPAACATATVVAALEQAGPVVGRRVLVSGAGMLGLTASAAAVDAGAAGVVVVDIDDDRRALAGKFGATEVVRAGDATGPVDVALEFSGASAAVTAGLDALDVGGRLVLVGSVSPGRAVALDPERLVRGWQTVTGVHNYEPRHLLAAVGLLADSVDRWPWADLVAAPVGLDDVGRLLDTPGGREPRVAVVPGGGR